MESARAETLRSGMARWIATRMSRMARALTGAAWCLCVAARLAHAQRADIVARCQIDTRAELARVRAGVDTIWFGDAPSMSSALNMGAQVAGAGIVHDLVTRQWRRFQYSCAWMPNTFQTGVSLRVDSVAFRR